MPQTHDQIMKELITAFPTQFLELAAPELAARLLLEEVSFEPREHYPGSPSRRERRPDLVAEVRSLQGELALAHVEIELDRRAEAEPKLLRYQRGLSLKYELPVHSIVLFLRGGLPGPRENVYRERSMGQTLIEFHYYSLGLSQASATEYLARPQPLAWALAALMKPRKGQSRAELGLACLRRITGDPELTDNERSQLCNVVTSYVQLDDRAAEELEELLAEKENKAMQEMITTWAERMETKGFERGRQEGRLEAARDLVLRLLSQKFGRPSAAVRRKITAEGSAEELARLAEKVVQAGSLRELGLASN